MSLRTERRVETDGHTKLNKKERAKEIFAEQIANGEKRKPHPDKTRLKKRRSAQRDERMEEKEFIASQALEPVTLAEQETPHKINPEATLIIHENEITSSCAKTWLEKEGK